MQLHILKSFQSGLFGLALVLAWGCQLVDMDLCAVSDFGCNPINALAILRGRATGSAAVAGPAACRRGPNLRESFYTFVGGAGNQIANAVCATADGGLIVGGNSTANIPTLGGKTPLIGYALATEMLIVKLAADGSVDWYTFFGSVPGNETVKSILQTADGGFLIAADGNANMATLGGVPVTNPYTGNNDVIVMKLSAAGALQWFTFIGGTLSDTAGALTVTTDGAVVVAANGGGNIPTESGKTPLFPHNGLGDLLVFRLSSAGDLEWYTFLGSAAGLEGARGIAPVEDGGVVVVGVAGGDIPTLGGKTPLYPYNTATDGLIVRLSATGAIDWYGFVGSAGADTLYAASAGADGSIVVSGYATGNIPILGGKVPTHAYTATESFLIAKLTSAGAVDWYSFFGSAADLEARAVVATADGGALAAGYSNANIATFGGKTSTYAYGGGQDVLAAKFSSTGALDWYTFLGGTSAQGVVQTEDGGFLFAAETAGNIPTLGGQTPLLPYVAGNDQYVIRLKPDGTF